MFVITLITSGLQIRKLGATRRCKTFANEQACLTSEETFLIHFYFQPNPFQCRPPDRQNVSLSFCQDLKRVRVVLHVKEKSLYGLCCSCGGDSSYGVMGHWPWACLPACSAYERATFHICLE